MFAGGESRRMGRDKATLLFDGEPLWSRQLRTLRELQTETIFISARTRPAWCPPEIETVLDESPSRGPLSGLAAALNSIQTTHLLALAVDMPLMDAAFLDGLSARARKGCGVVGVVAGGHYEPLAAIYPREALAEVRRFADTGGTAFQPLLAILIAERLMTAVRISRSENNLFQNINTRRDLEARI
jgi:molybdopterin-guanine dinucleotide biosynthesis protein A